MHGIPKAIRARSTAARVFWSLVCVAAALMFCVQFAQLLQKYYSYPKKVGNTLLPSCFSFSWSEKRTLWKQIHVESHAVAGKTCVGYWNWWLCKTACAFESLPFAYVFMQKTPRNWHPPLFVTFSSASETFTGSELVRWCRSVRHCLSVQALLDQSLDQTLCLPVTWLNRRSPKILGQTETSFSRCFLDVIRGRVDILFLVPCCCYERFMLSLCNVQLSICLSVATHLFSPPFLFPLFYLAFLDVSSHFEFFSHSGLNVFAQNLFHPNLFDFCLLVFLDVSQASFPCRFSIHSAVGLARGDTMPASILVYT